MKKGKIHSTWISINDRCLNYKSKSYKDYGERGIKLCREWWDFDVFYNDMNESMEEHIKEHGIKNTSLDRIDVNGHYCKENCRWATMEVQANNRRNTKYVVYKGERQTIDSLCKRLNNGVTNYVAYNRMWRGWSLEEAFGIKKRKRT